MAGGITVNLHRAHPSKVICTSSSITGVDYIQTVLKKNRADVFHNTKVFHFIKVPHTI